MGKYNKPATVRSVESRSDATVNYEGGLAFKTSPKTDLTLRMMTWLVGEPKFYGDKATETKDIEELIGKVAVEDPEYLMKLASFARNEMYLRSAPIFLLIEATKHVDAKPFIKRWTPKIICRADELTESLALFIQKNGSIGSQGKASLSHCLKDGLAASFHNFNRYQFAKYDRDGAVKLRDVLRLVHPKPKDTFESETFKMIKERTLPAPDTWEVAISTKGSTKENWESILPKMGYMAVLRNINNFIKVGLEPSKVTPILTNPKLIADSKQFPFRFLSAYKAVHGNIWNEHGWESTKSEDPFIKKEYSKALEIALELSVKNVPYWVGRTFITCDSSSSMDCPISQRSTVWRSDIGMVMGALASRISDNGIASVFGEAFQVVDLDGSNVLADTVKLASTEVGHSTNAWKAIEYLLSNNIKVNRILLFSDMQCYDSASANRLVTIYGSRGYESLAATFKKYKSSINPKTYLYSFDLGGYGTSQFPEGESNVCMLGGFSDRVLEFIPKFETDKAALVKVITEYGGPK